MKMINRLEKIVKKVDKYLIDKPLDASIQIGGLTGALIGSALLGSYVHGSGALDFSTSISSPISNCLEYLFTALFYGVGALWGYIFGMGSLGMLYSKPISSYSKKRKTYIH